MAIIYVALLILILLAEDFTRALPTHSLTILEHEKGTAVISPR